MSHMVGPLTGPGCSNNRPLFPEIFVSWENDFVEAMNCFVAKTEGNRPSAG